MTATGMTPNGNYYLSKLHNSMSRSFTKTAKPNHQVRNKEVPGPGSYGLQQLSDFGYYRGVNGQVGLGGLMNRSFDGLYGRGKNSRTGARAKRNTKLRKNWNKNKKRGSKGTRNGTKGNGGRPTEIKAGKNFKKRDLSV